ncbi:MAG: hypothetical protein LBK44_07400, partial [Spirochaetales bacterium]|nr:hypothetical protein [Spirochaetales bacterium]
KIDYYTYAKEYYNKFPQNVKYYYFWSKDVLDARLVYSLREKFGDIRLPMEDMLEYFAEIDMFREIR